MDSPSPSSWTQSAMLDDSASSSLLATSMEALLARLTATSTASSIPSLLTPNILPSITDSMLPSLTDSLLPSSLLASLEALPKTVAETTPSILAPTPIRITPTLLSPPPSSFSSFHSSLGSSLSNPLSSLNASPLPSSSLGSNSSIGSAFSFLQIPSFDSFSLLERRRSAPEGTNAVEEGGVEKRRFSDIAMSRHAEEVEFRRRHSTASSLGGIERKTSNPRKQRTIYACGQTKVLEEAFHSQRYMVGTEREQLATKLGLTEAQVRVWFQNRRSKQRKISRASINAPCPPPPPPGPLPSPFTPVLSSLSLSYPIPQPNQDQQQ